MSTLLQRITTEHIEAEDRIRLSGELASGRTVGLWLTQRLLNRLVPHLGIWLEQRAGATPMAQVLQEFAQYKARTELVAQAPVRAGAADAQGVLVYSVDVASTASGIALKFKDQTDTVVASLQLQPTPLRQWLNIMYDQYQRAGWLAEVWPLWVAEAKPSPTSSRAAVLH